MTERGGLVDGHVFFYGDERLEGILESPGPSAADSPTDLLGGVVVSHPHPLMGGTMAQPLVYRIAHACREHRMAALRFNFRGVGQSRGSYSGIDEHRDVEAAAAFLRGRLGPDIPVALAGYSFGSVMTALAADGPTPVEALALVAFVATMQGMPDGALDRLRDFRGPVLAVCGEEDELAPPEVVEAVLRDLRLDFRLIVVQGADHFFAGKQEEVGAAVATFLEGAFRAGRTL